MSSYVPGVSLGSNLSPCPILKEQKRKCNPSMVGLSGHHYLVVGTVSSLCSAEDHSISESSMLRQLRDRKRERAWRVQDTGRLEILQPRQPHSRLIDGNCTAVLLWFS